MCTHACNHIKSIIIIIMCCVCIRDSIYIICNYSVYKIIYTGSYIIAPYRSYG